MAKSEVVPAIPLPRVVTASGLETHITPPALTAGGASTTEPAPVESGSESERNRVLNGEERQGLAVLAGIVLTGALLGGYSKRHTPRRVE